MAKDKKGGRKTKKKKERRTVVHGIAHIKATFNNTLICITDLEGNVLAHASAGGRDSGGVERVPLSPLLRPPTGLRPPSVTSSG